MVRASDKKIGLGSTLNEDLSSSFQKSESKDPKCNNNCSSPFVLLKRYRSFTKVFVVVFISYDFGAANNNKKSSSSSSKTN